MQITVSAHTVFNWRHGGTSATLRLFADNNYLSSTGEWILSGNALTGEGCFREIDCVVAGTTLTIDSFADFPSTTDSPTLPTATWTARLYDQRGIAREFFLVSFGVDHAFGASQSWPTIISYNNPQGPPPDQNFLSASQIGVVVNQAVGTFNDASKLVKGRSYLTEDPAISSSPKAVSDNDRRVYDASSYASMADAVTALAAVGASRLIISSPQTVSDDLTIPATLTLQRIGAGTITIAANKTLIIKGPIEAGPYLMFPGSGVVSFAGNTVLSEIWPLWWGGAGDATAVGVGTDNLYAFNAASAAAASLTSFGRRSVGLFYPFGNYYFSSTVMPNPQTVLEGVNAGGDAGPALGDDQGGGTVFYFPDGSNGIKLSSATGAAHAGYTIVRNITLFSKGTTGATAHGVFAETPVFLDNVSANHFKGHGLFIDGSAHNANGWVSSNCKAKYNGGDGLHVNGNDANAGMITGFTATLNTGWGIWDESVEGNTYLAPLLEQNVIGGFHSSNSLGTCNFVGPHAEGGGANDITNANVFGNQTVYNGYTATSTGNIFGQFGSGPSLQLFGTGTPQLRLSNTAPSLGLEFTYIDSGQTVGHVYNRYTGSVLSKLDFGFGVPGANAPVLVLQHTNLGYFTKGADVPAASSITPTGNEFTITGASTTISTIVSTNVNPGTILYMITTSSQTFDNAGNMTFNGGGTNLVTAANDMIIAQWDGSKFRVR